MWPVEIHWDWASWANEKWYECFVGQGFALLGYTMKGTILVAIEKMNVRPWFCIVRLYRAGDKRIGYSKDEWCFRGRRGRGILQHISLSKSLSYLSSYLSFRQLELPSTKIPTKPFQNLSLLIHISSQQPTRKIHKKPFQSPLISSHFLPRQQERPPTKRSGPK